MTADIVILRGPAASGKSTYAMDLRDQGYCRINKDDLRAMLHSSWSKFKEQATVTAHNEIANSLVLTGRKIVVDNTHLLPRDRAYWDAFVSRHNVILAEGYKLKLEYVDFFNVPLEVCIERDSVRCDSARVGEAVIRRHFNLMKDLIEYEKTNL